VANTHYYASILYNGNFADTPSIKTVVKKAGPAMPANPPVVTENIGLNYTNNIVARYNFDTNKPLLDVSRDSSTLNYELESPLVPTSSTPVLPTQTIDWSRDFEMKVDYTMNSTNTYRRLIGWGDAGNQPRFQITCHGTKYWIELSNINQTRSIPRNSVVSRGIDRAG
jgi:hypothetical protein